MSTFRAFILNTLIFERFDNSQLLEITLFSHDEFLIKRKPITVKKQVDQLKTVAIHYTGIVYVYDFDTITTLKSWEASGRRIKIYGEGSIEVTWDLPVYFSVGGEMKNQEGLIGHEITFQGVDKIANPLISIEGM